MGIEIQNIALLYESTIQLFAAILAIALFDVLYTKIITKRINIVIALLEDQLINKLKCYFSFSGQKKLTILQNSVTNAVKCISTFFYGLIYLSIVLLCSITYGMIINFWVVGSGVILSSILVIISCKYGKNLLEKSKASEEATNEVYEKLWEINDNLEIMPFLDEKKAYKHLDAAIIRENRFRVETGKLVNFSRILMRFSHIGTVLFAGLFGGICVYLNKISSVDLMGIILLLPLISDNLFQIPAKISDFYSISGICDVMNDFITSDDIHIASATVKNRLEKIDTIEVQNFCYMMNDFKKITVQNFHLDKNKICGIWGMSGSGKTTFLRTLTKLISKYEGKIFFNQFELRSIDCVTLWQQISYLEQEAVIIPGSVMDNIVLDQKLDLERYRQAVHLALLDNFVESREIDDREICVSDISSGEKQQICLARVFYHAKQLIILDEATNALSPKNEKLIIKNIVKWVKQQNIILILVSHNKELMTYCDKIITF